MSVVLSPEALVASAAALCYLLAIPKGRVASRLPSLILTLAWLLHGAALLIDIAGVGTVGGARFGFAPALSGAIWLVLAVHAVESRFVPLPGVRRALAAMGVLVCALLVVYPGDIPLKASSPLVPFHLLLGIASYGLFGAAVIHGLMLDSAERAMRRRPGTPGAALGTKTGPASGVAPTGPGAVGLFGMPLLRLERLTFRFVEAGFAVLSLALLLGLLAVALGHVAWRWDHKTVFSLLGWLTFALLIAGRHGRGWRGRRATRWLYVGAGLLVLAYIGSRFVIEVVLQRGV